MFKVLSNDVYIDWNLISSRSKAELNEKTTPKTSHLMTSTPSASKRPTTETKTEALETEYNQCCGWEIEILSCIHGIAGQAVQSTCRSCTVSCLTTTFNCSRCLFLWNIIVVMVTDDNNGESTWKSVILVSFSTDELKNGASPWKFYEVVCAATKVEIKLHACVVWSQPPAVWGTWV